MNNIMEYYQYQLYYISNWYKAVRRKFNLPPMCQRRFVYQIARDMPFEMQLLCRFVIFFSIEGVRTKTRLSYFSFFSDVCFWGTIEQKRLT